MKKVTLTLLLTLFCVSGIVAQQNPADAPASKQDVERYFQVTHTRETTKQILEVMAKEIRNTVHERISKDRGSLPLDAEERMNKRTDEMLKNLPVDEMIDVMVTVYQKHWTKGDVDNLIAFYSTPTGKKLRSEMPQTMAEAMQALRPVMQKQMDTMKQQIDQQVAELKKEYNNGHAKKPEPISN